MAESLVPSRFIELLVVCEFPKPHTVCGWVLALPLTCFLGQRLRAVFLLRVTRAALLAPAETPLRASAL